MSRAVAYSTVYLHGTNRRQHRQEGKSEAGGGDAQEEAAWYTYAYAGGKTQVACKLRQQQKKERCMWRGIK